ncbi:MAG: lipopolysaccharide export system permease protein [Gammaproteobacteria bacterium]|jgi:lipopolysaccharide export system permease protein
MIINRYILIHIHKGSLLTLLVLVSLATFFLFIGELEDLGRGRYDLLAIFKYIGLRLPAKLVEFMPLAALLGTILSMGVLASNSEIIALQASGYSVINLIVAVMQAAIVLALLSYLIADFVVPYSETNARQFRSLAIDNNTSVVSKKGIWIKDQSQILHIDELLPDGMARRIEIYEIGGNNQIKSILLADWAVAIDQQWILRDVQQTVFGKDNQSVFQFDRLPYNGNISNQLLAALIIKPRQMSTFDLFDYVNFLGGNQLDHSVESLTLWQKVLSPLSIIIMCLLAVPFVLGSQRQSNSGQRLMFGIVIGLLFVVGSRLSTQLGIQIGLVPFVNAIIPILIFLLLAIYLIHRKIQTR